MSAPEWKPRRLPSGNWRCPCIAANRDWFGPRLTRRHNMIPEARSASSHIESPLIRNFYCPAGHRWQLLHTAGSEEPTWHYIGSVDDERALP